MSKINTVKKFVRFLERELGNDRFVVYTNRDEGFKHYPDDQVSFHGEDTDEVFTFEVVHVDPKKRLRKIE